VRVSAPKWCIRQSWREFNARFSISTYTDLPAVQQERDAARGALDAAVPAEQRAQARLEEQRERLPICITRSRLRRRNRLRFVRTCSPRRAASAGRRRPTTPTAI
jgi:hypothetical protein